MKRIVSYFAFFAALMLTSNLFAAMVCVDSGSYTAATGRTMLKVTCTFDATPGTAEDDLPYTSMERGDGMFVYSFVTVPGSTGPTINSDLAIADCRGVNILDAATGHGANVIDNSTVNGPFYGDGPTIGTDNHNPLMHQWCAWTVTVTNNAVNNSSFILYMEMDK